MPWSRKIPHAAEQLGPWAMGLRVWSLCSATGEATTVRGPRTANKTKQKAYASRALHVGCDVSICVLEGMCEYMCVNQEPG